MIVEEHSEYRSNIVGIPGQYAVKAQGNGRIMVRDIPTIEEAREWIKTYRDRCPTLPDGYCWVVW